MCGHLHERYGLKYKEEWMVNAVKVCEKKWRDFFKLLVPCIVIQCE